MRICIVGAGAIGGLLAARLTASGESVTLVARGEQHDAIQRAGLRLTGLEGADIHVHPALAGNVKDVRDQDMVVLAVKAHQVAAIARDAPACLTQDGLVLTAQNGIPWWYFFRHGGPYEGRVLQSVDPGGVIAASLPIERVLGSVVYPAAEIAAPGVIRLIEGNRFSLGEPDNSRSDRAQAISRVLTGAGFKAPVSTDIRSEIWTKLWGNLSFNPISALTGATLAGVCRHHEARSLACDMMREAQAVGEALGTRFRISLEKRIAGAESVGEHKTSMLQDVEAGRRTEVDALLGSVLELGRMTNVQTPAISSLYGLMRLLEDTRCATSPAR